MEEAAGHLEHNLFVRTLRDGKAADSILRSPTPHCRTYLECQESTDRAYCDWLGSENGLRWPQAGLSSDFTIYSRTTSFASLSVCSLRKTG
jgi:hypothetical protein